MVETLVFLLGLVIGSFLNVCIYRLPAGESVVSPPSHCRTCGVRLGPLDIIPVISYLLSRGRCRHCGAAYPARYALVELVTGALFVWCFFVFGLGPALVKALVLVCFLVVITFIDYDHQLILDKVLVWFAGAGAAINLALNSYPQWAPLVGVPAPHIAPYLAVEKMLAGGLMGGGILLVVALVTSGGMGGGDIKFTAALGLWFGWQQTLLLIFLSFLFGGVGSFSLLALGIKKRKDFIPFGPFIAAGALATLLYGPRILLWYGQPWLIR